MYYFSDRNLDYWIRNYGKINEQESAAIFIFTIILSTIIMDVILLNTQGLIVKCSHPIWKIPY